MACFASSASRVVVCGTVFGMSKYVVTPPAAAARLSVLMSAFSVSPGSRKCTWLSITPGSTKHPAALMRLSKVPSMGLLPSMISDMYSSSMTIEPLNVCSSFTIVPPSIIVLIVSSLCLPEVSWHAGGVGGHGQLGLLTWVLARYHVKLPCLVLCGRLVVVFYVGVVFELV